MKRINSVELMNLPFGSRISVASLNPNRSNRKNINIGIVFGEKIGYEDGAVQSINDLSIGISTDLYMVYLLEENRKKNSESKFNVTICKCGRIHFIPNEEISKAINKDKELMIICGSCGSAYVIGADFSTLLFEPEETEYDIYCFDKGSNDTDFELTKADFKVSSDKKALSKIIYSNGKRVYMETGYYAQCFDHSTGIFSDTYFPVNMDSLKNMSQEEVKQFVEKWQHDSQTVSMNSLLKSLTEDEAEALSHYHIEGLDWKGTNWESKYN